MSSSKQWGADLTEFKLDILSSVKQVVRDELARAKAEQPAPSVASDLFDSLRHIEAAASSPEASSSPVQELPSPTNDVRKIYGRRREGKQPRLQLMLRPPVDLAVPFIEFCEKNRYTYWQAVEELMRRAQLI